MSRLLFIVAAASLPAACSAIETDRFSISESEQGIELREFGKPVFHYQLKEQSQGGKWPRSNYLHPVYDLDGKVLTEDFPADHGHHRGIFWAWHQLMWNGKPLADPWACQGIQWAAPGNSTAGAGVQTSLNDAEASVTVTRHWRVEIDGAPADVVKDQATVTVGAAEEGIRRIDFEIKLRALRRGISIGGSENAKGYGGFSTRFALDPPFTFSGPDGSVVPKVEAVPAGKWLTMRRQPNRRASQDVSQTHASILCHPSHPGFPAPWILRSQRSMQNVAWPGRHAVALSTDVPVVLRYRLLIHRTSLSADALNKQWEMYSQSNGAASKPEAR